MRKINKKTQNKNRNKKSESKGSSGSGINRWMWACLLSFHLNDKSRQWYVHSSACSQMEVCIAEWKHNIKYNIV